MNTLITVLGWEERFYRGTEITLDKYNVSNMILIVFSDYLPMQNMEDNQNRVEELAKSKGIEVTYLRLNYSDSVSNWKLIDNNFDNLIFQEEVLLNITTIPRETIWMLLFFLKKIKSSINYIYFKPESYCEDWLTKNHKNPRLLFKHSGIFELDKPLVLFIITGFDGSRLDSLLDFYEPAKIIVFGQCGNQFNNEERNNGLKVSNSIDFDKIEFDSYNVDSASKVIDEQIQKHEDYNIIIASQGPKLSSLSTYHNYQSSKAKIGLAYVPAKEFNEKYSIGIDENYISGEFNL